MKISEVFASLRTMVHTMVAVLNRRQAASLNRRHIAFGSGFVILMVICVGLGWQYWQTRQQLELLQNPERAAQQQAQKVAAQVNKLILLPEEIPTLATVTDRSLLPQQEFFQNAQNGDQVLLYTNAKKVFLYRPSAKKLVNVASLSVQANQALTTSPGIGQSSSSEMATGAAELASPSSFVISVALYNGTTTSGLSNRYATRLTEQHKEISVVTKTNAAASTYQKSLIIDVNGTQAEKVTQLATQLNLEKSSLPEGEDKPTADILIILGSDVVAVQ